jgi:hypothetical protein
MKHTNTNFKPDLDWVDFFERFDRRIEELISANDITFEQAEKIVNTEFNLDD